MFKPVEMQKIRIVALNSVARRLVSELHEMGIMEITRIPESELKTNTTFSDFTEISKRLIQLRAVKNVLRNYSTKDSKKKISEDKIDALDEELKSLVKEATSLQAQLKKYKDDLKLINKLTSFSFDFSKLKTSVTDYTIGTIQRTNFVKAMNVLEKYNKDFKLMYRLTKNEAILLFLRKQDFHVGGLLDKFNFVRLSIPKEMTTPEEYRKKLMGEAGRVNIRLAAVNARLTTLAEDYYSSIAELSGRYEIASQQSEIASKFGFSEKIAVMEGWVEKNNLENLAKKINSEFGNKADVFKIEKSKDKPPIKLENPDSLKTVEYFVHMFSLPNNKELDPTFLFFFTGPLFYGMIMGDVIYGILSLIISYLILIKMKPKGLLLFTVRLWMFAAIPAIFFGLFFDEWMAMPHEEFFNYIGSLGLGIHLAEPLYHGFSRIHNLSQLIGISAIIGVFHLALGFLVGAVNYWSHNKKHAIAKLAWIGVDIGGMVAIMSLMFNMFPETIGIYALGTIIISTILVMWGEGPVGLLELPGLAGNILSYARIAAVGVVGVILAEIINMFFMPDPSQGILLVIVMLPLLLVMHAVNTVIVMVEALIQGGRLNIVEFQSKFMHGGGREFRPFMLKTENN